MKKLLLIRHAKSDWGNPSLPDFERPLKRRGVRDTGNMVQKIRFLALQPDYVITSPARRALETASIIADGFDIPDTRVITHPSLYPGTPEAFAKVVESIPEDYRTVCLFGHNPAISEYISLLVQEEIDMKTCTMVVCDIPGRWHDLSVAEQFMVVNP